VAGHAAIALIMLFILKLREPSFAPFEVKVEVMFTPLLVARMTGLLTCWNSTVKISGMNIA
jgi:hypothetical protein